MKKILVILIVLAFLNACSFTPQQSDNVVFEEKSSVLQKQEQEQELNDLEQPQSFGTREISRSDRQALDDFNTANQYNREIRIIYFEFDSSTIKQEDQAIIEAHASYLAANQNVLVTLAGHADERGSREYNLALGEQRANTIERLMVLLNVPAHRIRVTSYGEEKPIIAEQNEYAWSQNRRVEIIY